MMTAVGAALEKYLKNVVNIHLNIVPENPCPLRNFSCLINHLLLPDSSVSQQYKLPLHQAPHKKWADIAIGISY